MSCLFSLESKTCVKRPLSTRPKLGFQDQLSLNAGLNDKKVSNIYIMAILVHVIEFHIGKVINRPPCQKAHMVTSLIFKGIEWGFRKYMSSKILGMVHQGLLAPQSLTLLIKVWHVKTIQRTLDNSNPYTLLYNWLLIAQILIKHIQGCVTKYFS